MSVPVSKLEWTPGPTGAPEPPSFSELRDGLLDYADSGPGLSFEAGKPKDGMPVVNFVFRNTDAEPIGILALRYFEGEPELVDIAVRPDQRRKGVAWNLCLFAKERGIDLRDIGAIHEGPLTDEGRALRDIAFERGADIFGPPAWEED